jgi:hypothetical protein
MSDLMSAEFRSCCWPARGYGNGAPGRCPATASRSATVIPPALLELLGRIVYQWAFVEAVAGMMFAFLLHADNGLSHVLTANV